MDWVFALNEMKKNRGLTTDEIAEKSGIPRGTLNKIFAGQTKDPQLNTVTKLVHCMGYALDDLEDLHPTAPQPPHYADLHQRYRAIVDAASAEAYEQQLAEEQSTATQDIPPLDIMPFRLSAQPASAGHGIDLGPENFHNIYVRKGCLPRGARFGVPVAGNSMEPRYHDGDILIVDGQPVDQGEIGVFTLNGDGYVKRLGNGELISLNPDYEPIAIDDDDYFKHNGRVIGVLDPDCIVK